MRKGARGCGGRHRHAAPAWLGIVALLISALAPPGVAAALASQASVAASGAFCGAAPSGTAPDKQTPPARRHCVLCLAAPAGGLLPAPAPVFSPRQYAETTTVGLPARQIAPTRFAYASARPRGPPVSR